LVARHRGAILPALSPLLLLFITKARQYVLPMVLGAAALSFAYALYLAFVRPEDAGYLNSFARFWELLVGSAIALWGRSPLKGPIAICARWVGMGAILVAILWVTEEMAFPGYLALLPTLGAGLVILAGGEGRDPILLALKSRPATYIGRLSYSLYLWHWPILVAIRYFFDAPSGWLLASGVVISFAMAALSYHLVETPFRQRRVFATRLPLFGAAAAAASMVVFVVSVDRLTGGMPFRFDENIRVAVALSNHTDPLDCRNVEVSPGLEGCLYGKSPQLTDVNVIVWGDSLATGPRKLFSEFAENGGSLLLFSTPSCGPLLDTWKERDRSRTCAAKNAAVAKFARSTHAKVILIAAWNDLSTNHSGPFRLVNQSQDPKTAKGVFKLFKAGLNATLSSVAGLDVAIVGQPPRYPVEIDRYVIKRLLLGLPLPQLVSANQYIKATSKVQSAVSATAKVHYVDVARQFCTPTNCRYHKDEVPLYHDGLHLNSMGALALRPILEPILGIRSAAARQVGAVTVDAPKH
jgi:hypothetical protein